MKYTLLIVCLLALVHQGFTQTCNPNFDFEEGIFDHWERNAGVVTSTGETILNPAAASGDRFTLIPSMPTPLLDLYGHFPLNSPNGSNYCIKLGNAQSGAQAEQVSYTFDIPADKNDYSVIFNYAVVFQNPSHAVYEQPRFTSKVYDVTNSKYIECGSFDFAASSGLPGFYKSDVPSSTDVFYKPWSSVTIKLAGYQGRTIRIEFTTNDCTRGGHFGYAYIDVVNNCNGALVTGNVYCKMANSLTLTAPVGFLAYNWYTEDFSKKLGTSNKLELTPVPLPGTKYALEIIPYPGLGCTDTIYPVIKNAKDSFEFKVKDSIAACLPGGTILATALDPNNTRALTYQYFTDQTESVAVPGNLKVTATAYYYIRAESPSGCTDVKPVLAIAWPVPDFAVKDPPRITAPATIDLSGLVSDPRNTYSYWLDVNSTQTVVNPSAVNASGTYYIRGKDSHGCTASKPVNLVIGARMAMPSAFSPNGDSKNDVFRFVARGGVKELTYFKVFDRWGHLVYSTKTYGEGWDGKIGGKLQDPGVYIWMVRAVDYTGEVFEQKGTVVLIR